MKRLRVIFTTWKNLRVEFAFIRVIRVKNILCIRVHPCLEIAGFFAIFHRGFAGFVVGAGTAFGHARGGNLGDDVIQAVSAGFNQYRY